MKKVRKAVIPAAGFGTRFLPQTKAMPKEMLPIIDKPIIQYVVEELVDIVDDVNGPAVGLLELAVHVLKSLSGGVARQADGQVVHDGFDEFVALPQFFAFADFFHTQHQVFG